jgi:hypothetical protein
MAALRPTILEALRTLIANGLDAAPDYSAAKTYIVGDIVKPRSNNAGACVYELTTIAGTGSATAADWSTAQTLSETCTDGDGNTWTNIGTSAPGAVTGVYLPWQEHDARERDPYLLIDIDDTSVDTGEVIGQWVHTIGVKVLAVVQGQPDIQAAWDLLADASAAIQADTTLGGLCQRVDVTGAADAITVSGNRILSPHIQAEIVYLTAAGTL